MTLRISKVLLEIPQASKKSADSSVQVTPEVMVEDDEEFMKEDTIKVNKEKVGNESTRKSEAKKKATNGHLNWVSPLPFPQRFQKKAVDDLYKKFLEIFKQLHINIPFIEALEHMPKYGNFLKEMLSKKKHFTEFATIALTKEITSVIKPNVPFKCKDPSSFTIPCLMGDKFECRALCDLESTVNLMSLSVFKKLQLGEVNPTTVTLQLADRSLSYPYGIIKDVLVKVDSFIYPADFIVLDIEEDKEIPLIVGRTFFATARALVDVEKGEVILRLGDEQIKFNTDKAMKDSKEKKQCAKVAVIDKLNQVESDSFTSKEPFQATRVEKKTVEDAYFAQTKSSWTTSISSLERH
ncbi:uncharacterized protein LOC114728500 [Neltuma alba]|uniref:uncharacterized protein LOC114728500 n=1 Tax=Neltuma alba TaxID=207710 RepID=UPI0010A54C73|nr:uncharacterized protein LOC114728500 [Prosopis alba]